MRDAILARGLAERLEVASQRFENRPPVSRVDFEERNFVLAELADARRSAELLIEAARLAAIRAQRAADRRQIPGALMEERRRRNVIGARTRQAAMAG